MLGLFTLVGVEPHYFLDMSQTLYRWATVYCIYYQHNKISIDYYHSGNHRTVVYNRIFAGGLSVSIYSNNLFLHKRLDLHQWLRTIDAVFSSLELLLCYKYLSPIIYGYTWFNVFQWKYILVLEFNLKQNFYKQSLIVVRSNSWGSPFPTPTSLKCVINKCWDK